MIENAQCVNRSLSFLQDRKNKKREQLLVMLAFHASKEKFWFLKNKSPGSASWSENHCQC